MNKAKEIQAINYYIKSNKERGNTVRALQLLQMKIKLKRKL